MRCEACREPIGDAFYVVDGQDWCPRCERGVATRTPAWRGMLGGLAGGVAGAVVALTVVGSLPWDSIVIHMVNGSALPAALLVGGAVRLGRRDYRSPILPIAAVALTFLVVAVALIYCAGNLDGDDSGYSSMTEILTRIVSDSDLILLLLPLAPVVFGVLTGVGAVSLGIGLYAAFEMARGVPISVDGPFEATPDPAFPAPAF